MSDSADVLVLGTGVAGCAAALAAARGGSEVAIVTRASEAEASKQAARYMPGCTVSTCVTTPSNGA